MFSIKQPEASAGDPDRAKEMQRQTITNFLLFFGIVIALRLTPVVLEKMKS